MAPFNRYQTLDVVRAVAESGRSGDIALYTGNDDSIVADLLTPFRFGNQTVRIVGGLLGHWSVWVRRAVELLERVHNEPEWPGWLTLATLGGYIRSPARNSLSGQSSHGLTGPAS